MGLFLDLELIFEGGDLFRLDLKGMHLINLQGRPSDLPESYKYVTNEDGEGFILGPGVNLDGANLDGMDLSTCNLDKICLTNLTGEPSKLPDGYQYLTNKDGLGFIFGPGVNLDGFNLEGVDFSKFDLNHVSCSNLKGGPSGLPDGYQYLTNKDGLGFIFGPGVNLEGADLKEVNLKGANLEGADLTAVNLQGAILQNAILKSVKLDKANLIGSDLRDVDFNGIELDSVRLDKANVQGAKFNGSRIYWGQVDLIGEPISLPKNCSYGTDKSGNGFIIGPFGVCKKFERANLEDVTLEGACLVGLSLRKADLRNANLRNADLRRVDFRRADLRCDLSGSNLEDAKLHGAKVDSTTKIILPKASKKRLHRERRDRVDPDKPFPIYQFTPVNRDGFQLIKKNL